MVPSKKIAHITLGHSLNSLLNLSLDQRALLIQLARITIDFDRSIRWNFRLYSREQSSMNEVVFFAIDYIEILLIKFLLYFQVVYRVVSSLTEMPNSHSLWLKSNDLFMVLDNGHIGEQEYVYGE